MKKRIIFWEKWNYTRHNHLWEYKVTYDDPNSWTYSYSCTEGAWLALCKVLEQTHELVEIPEQEPEEMYWDNDDDDYLLMEGRS